MVHKKSKYNTRIQEIMAICSFVIGTIISCVCLFIIEPLGEIDTTAISIVSEFLVLAGALLGVKATFDNKMHQFEARIDKITRDENIDYEDGDTDN